VDFEQGVNFAIKQVREALSDQAEHPIYIQTVPKRGYRFLAPVSVGAQTIPAPEPQAAADPLEKALWANIAELRLAEGQHRKRQQVLTAALVLIGLGLAVLFLIRG
jgi:DNA-binding winged helix-turn-helix (wHTH) protein